MKSGSVCVVLSMCVGCASSVGGGGGGGAMAVDATEDLGFTAATKDTASTGSDTFTDACTPACNGKECGNDGCGGTCGACPAAAPTCSAAAKCVTSCAPACSGKECGDDGCGGTCGTCPDAAAICDPGTFKCKSTTCKPSCAANSCGNDGCGGTCKCASGSVCAGTTCVAPCSPADNFCDGTTLHFCDASGAMGAKLCSDADCKAAGFVAFSQCGANTGQNKTCLCEACTAADEKCAANTAYTCDAVTGKLTAQACGAGMQCKNAACVKPCTDECTQDACNAGGQVVACQVGVDGCKKKLAPADCIGGLVCVAGSLGCAACTASGQCDAQSVCGGNGKCTTAFGHTYTIKILSGNMPLTDSTGSAWDAFGGAPDPFVNIEVNDTIVATTTSQQDTFTPVWGESFDVVLQQTDVLSLAVWDEDTTVATSDYMDGVKLGSWLAWVKSGTGNSGPLYSGSTMSLSYTIKPK